MTDRRTWRSGLSIGRLSPEALEKAAKAGLACVEVCAIQDDNDALWKEVPRWAADAGIEVWSFHLPFRWKFPIANPATLDEEEWKQTYEQDVKWIRGAAEGGLKVMVIHPSLEPIADDQREAQMQSAIEHLGILSDECKKNGLVLAVEDLPRTCLCRDGDEAVRLMESNHDLRLCFDVNHLLRGDHETCHEDFVAKAGKYIITTHISDYDFTDEKHWFPMDGKIDWKRLQAALEKADYTGPFLYETMPQGYTWEDVHPNHLKLMDL